VAVVAAGITAYEAAAVGVPTVAGALVPAQRPTLAAFAERGAVADGGDWWGADVLDRTDAAARAVARLLDDPHAGGLLAGRARGLVDGFGVARVARAIAAWAEAA
jgi:spore coat polysaccharide biosynthesis predicted glycosyltransferase SpsG